MAERDFDLSGKIILVTGAAGLIGAEACDVFAAYGADLVITDLGGEGRLEGCAQRLRADHPKSRILDAASDITDPTSVKALFERIRDEYGRLDVLLNLAAIDAKFDRGKTDINPTRFESFPMEAWEKSVSVNCTGMIRITQAAVHMMLAQGKGNIINVASTYSLVAPNHDLYKVPGQVDQLFKPVDYVGTKSIVPNFTRYLATLYGRQGIRANAIAPHGIANNHDTQFRENFARLSPMGRMCGREELRGPLVLLASDASSYMTGTTLVVDGGWTAW
jgi:NAD(P)-dependent dehydrogenase (short-subunit alcohol dehydrogenase family)